MRCAFSPVWVKFSFARRCGAATSDDPLRRRVSNADAGPPQRQADKKPCRVLFVRNVEYSITEQDIRELFAPFGEIKTVFDLIAKRGLVFVTFYDLRCAERAKNELLNRDFKSRKIDIHYSTPKQEDLGKLCDRDKNQGTVCLDLNDTKREFVKQELREFLSAFGELKDVRVSAGFKAFVEYYDSRACARAYDAIAANAQYKEGRIRPKFMWDDPPAKREQLADRRDSRDGRDDRRDRRDSRDRSRRSRSRSRSRSPPGRYNDRYKDDYSRPKQPSRGGLLDSLSRGAGNNQPAVLLL